ncbi:unknown [Prevotella sp. CAG:891]|nr:unknown [Prevotella sp. CAG:891]
MPRRVCKRETCVWMTDFMVLLKTLIINSSKIVETSSELIQTSSELISTSLELIQTSSELISTIAEYFKNRPTGHSNSRKTVKKCGHFLM